MSVVEIWRDNLNAGIYLTEYGPQALDTVLQSIGYSPGATDGSGDHNHFYGRLRRAIDTGAQRYTDREPQWFFMGAFQFNGAFFYRTLWYVNRYGQCLPLALDPIVRRVKDRRVKDTSTRIARTRASVAVDALYRIRRAMTNGDQDALNAIMRELAQDETYGPIMEIVTGHYGVEYVELVPLIDFLMDQSDYSPQRIGLNRAIKDIRKGRRLIERGRDSAALTLTNLVMLRGGSRNPRPQALSDARDKLASLPAA